MSDLSMAFFPANFMLQSSHDHDDEDDHQHHQQAQAPAPFHQILPSCPPQGFHGFAETPRTGEKRSVSFPGIEAVAGEDLNVAAAMAADDELSDDGSSRGERKRRLNIEQVKMLEKNFEIGNKLEPERKMQLARALGLQPRQIAIWFQNRRARWKTKQLEKDYDLLKQQFDAIKADNEALQAQNHKLHAEILALKNREPAESINLNKETDQGSCSNQSENSSDIRLDKTRGAISPLSAQNPPIGGRQLFPASIRPTTGVEVQQLFETSSRHASRQMDETVKEENNNVTNMFCGIDDHSGFWPWLEQHHFN
ncbi:hypothetical protein MLD38_037922 [Melastoma candidum]|uniref:Uncharacterized protein n=1 Tax=Melastoma candidum TaxID=119954 RepID=A0ACB9KYF5_9MYRT|nr:hypothetical protein MLD38_037922 [Melastoma candidum]